MWLVIIDIRYKHVILYATYVILAALSELSDYILCNRIYIILLRYYKEKSAYN